MVDQYLIESDRIIEELIEEIDRDMKIKLKVEDYLIVKGDQVRNDDTNDHVSEAQWMPKQNVLCL